MTMFLGSTTDSPVLSSGAQTPKVRRASRFGWRSLLAVWAAISAVWFVAVAYDLYLRVSEQADMSADVERDLDQGAVPVSCSGTDCSGSTESLQNRLDIAATYFRFGGDEMTECVFGPPLALLILGSGVILLMRWRRGRAA